MTKRTLPLLTILLLGALPAQAQLRSGASLNRLNRQLAGTLVDYTHNHGADRRLYSPILGMPRDLYVYLPPGYNPCLAYPLVLYFHMGYIDEHALLGPGRIDELDRMIRCGVIPPMIVAAPDGVYTGENHFRHPHSLFINGQGGRYEDHIIHEVLPFLMRCYSIRPEREAHGVLGASAGGLGAMDLALKHRDLFGAVATLAAPLNLRYANCHGDYLEDFNPATYRWKTVYDPDEVIGIFYFGLRRVRARRYVEPVFGAGPAVADRITANNPADLLFATDLRPSELALYVNYPGRDNWNFDAQDESFVWLAGLKGIAVTRECVPHGRHNLPYFRSNHGKAYLWLGQHLLPPAPVAPSG